MTINYHEKRDFIRMETDHSMHYRVPGSDSLEEGTCINLSATGIQFTTHQPLPAGTELEVNMTPALSVVAPLDAVIEVIRSQALGDSGEYSIAARITKMH